MSIPFLVNHFKKSCKAKAPKSTYVDRNDTIKGQEGSPIIPNILNYLCMFSSATSEECDVLHRTSSVKEDGIQNKSYQDLYNLAKVLTKKDICMKFYDSRKSLYLERKISGVGPGAGLLEAFTSKSLPSVEQG